MTTPGPSSVTTPAAGRNQLRTRNGRATPNRGWQARRASISPSPGRQRTTRGTHSNGRPRSNGRLRSSGRLRSRGCRSRAARVTRSSGGNRSSGRRGTVARVTRSNGRNRSSRRRGTVARVTRSGPPRSRAARATRSGPPRSRAEPGIRSRGRLASRIRPGIGPRDRTAASHGLPSRMAAGRTRSPGRLSLTRPASRHPGRITGRKRTLPAGIGYRKAGGMRRRRTRSCTPISRSGIRRRAVLPTTPTTTGIGTWARGSRRTPNPAWCPTPCARRLDRRIRRLARRHRRRLPRRRRRLRPRRTAHPDRRTPSPPRSPAVAKAAWAGGSRRPRRPIPVSRGGSTLSPGALGLNARLATGPPTAARAAGSTPPMSGRGQQASIRRASAIRFETRNHRQLSTPAVAAVGAEPTAGDLRRVRSLSSRTASSRRPARQRSRRRCRCPARRPPHRRR